MMKQAHKINHDSLEFTFTTLAETEAFESRAVQWVVQQLLPMMETVFDTLCPEHHTLVFDTLTLDLGELNASTFYAEAPEKLKQQLENLLRSQLTKPPASDIAAREGENGSHRPHSGRQNASLLSQQQQQWKILWQFLCTGALPWTVDSQQSPEALGLSV
ncbi:MAG: hypothetical protein XXXJIFNMEKO3_02243 [Candidatus Erwinia impunctatus]|nr:hypothetical protein XXXJIFNMEKO_02243 [Culicoides impunctatus]